jgi:inner membrane protein
MDSITHIALGAAAGEILVGKKLGKQALLIGAAANSFPDIDFLASLWLSPADNVLAHRGFTHSILCMVLLTLLFCWVAIKLDKQQRVSRNGWFAFFLLQLGLHLFVDAFNAYGVGWLIPFDDVRISFHTIFVVDPFYSFILIMAFILLAIYPVNNKYRTRMATVGLLISSMYLGYALLNKYIVNDDVKDILKKQNITYNRFFTTPTPLNTWLWFAVAEVDSGYQIGYRSVFDQTDSMPLTFVPKNEHLLEGLQEDHDLAQLKKFSQGYYTAEYRSDTLVFNDLRFGQITGWHTPHARFAFHYYLNYPDENLLVMQRGRFANWNEQTVATFLKRIKGNK